MVFLLNQNRARGRHPDRGCADRGADRPDDPVARHGRCSTERGSACTSTRWAAIPRPRRRAGISVPRVRITAFIICSCLAVVSGLFTVSQTGVVQSSTGRDIVLFGVGAAVVGGVSLFGGRGRLVQATVGALLISMITNGLGLLGYSAGITFLVTGGVLIIAATIDALSRRRSGSSSLAR